MDAAGRGTATAPRPHIVDLLLADKNSQKVAELQQRIEALAREAVPPLILREALDVAKPLLFAPVSHLSA